MWLLDSKHSIKITVPGPTACGIWSFLKQIQNESIEEKTDDFEALKLTISLFKNSKF